MIHTITALLIALGPTATHDSIPVDRPCKFEDSTFCVWDARHMGNGEGKSFMTTKKGKVIFISHRLAHRLLND